ncbi:MAG TPA: PAS domain S-box protein [Anaerolineaceae bacterium]
MDGISQEDVWHILYVEDDRDDFLLTRQIFACMQGRTVQLIWAANYDEAREKIPHGIYDAILVDYHLGAQTGVDLIREFNGQLEAPFILYTGVDDRSVDLEAQLAGATLFLAKNNATPELLERGIRYAIEHKRNELALRAITARLRYQADLLKHVHSPVIGTDENLRITFWNKAAEDTFGWTEAEALGRPGREIFPSSLDDSKRDEIIRFLIETGHYVGELTYRHKDGRMISTVVRSSALRGEDGAFRGLVSSIQDITERKQMEQALADSERQFRERVQNASTAIYEIDFRRRRFSVINDSMVQLTGYSRESDQGSRIPDAFYWRRRAACTMSLN